VFVHSHESPDDDEWNRLLDVFRQLPDLKRIRVLVFTYGGAPNARQRALLNEVLQNARPPVAVITPSAFARAAGTAISWFIPSIRTFAPEEVDRALDHLDASEADRRRLSEALVELRREVRGHSSGPPAPK
jgi:hypothetical protein